MPQARLGAGTTRSPTASGDPSRARRSAVADGGHHADVLVPLDDRERRRALLVGAQVLLGLAAEGVLVGAADARREHAQQHRARLERLRVRVGADLELVRGEQGRGADGCHQRNLTAGAGCRTARRRAKLGAVDGEGPMRKLQSQGVHHITIVGADRQTSIDFWEGLLGMPFVFEQPNLDNAVGEPPLLRPGRRAADHGLHQRGARCPIPSRTPTDPGCVHHLAFAVSQATLPPGGRAPRRARDPPQRRQGPRLHGLDLLRGPARPADRARVLPLRAAARPHPRRGAARGAQAAGRAGRLQHRPGPPRRRHRGARRRARASRCRTTARPRTPTASWRTTWPPTR